MAGPETGASAVGYRLAVPDDWWTVDLRAPDLQEQVDRLVARQWRGVDNAPHLRAQAAAQLLQTARDGADSGGERLALSLGRPGELPRSASLLVTPLDLGPDAPTPEVLGELGIAYAADDVEVGFVELPAGRALRATWTADPDPAAGLPATLCLDLVLAAGDGGGVLLSFRSPLTHLREPLLELFEAVASTVRFVLTSSTAV